jgi:hypothetical protein
MITSMRMRCRETKNLKTGNHFKNLYEFCFHLNKFPRGGCLPAYKETKLCLCSRNSSATFCCCWNENCVPSLILFTCSLQVLIILSLGKSAEFRFRNSIWAEKCTSININANNVYKVSGYNINFPFHSKNLISFYYTRSILHGHHQCLIHARIYGSITIYVSH